MTIDPVIAAKKAADIYDAAADLFDAPPLAFWERHGRRAVKLANLRNGEKVLDVGCGTGASAVPAAEEVGSKGSVLGVDVAANMLHVAADKAAASGLRNIEFRVADMRRLGEPDESFDAIISVFSIFFVPDMEKQVAELWRMLRPGGRLIATVWGPNSFHPAADVFAEELRRVRPDIPPVVMPWERLIKPAGFQQLFMEGGAAIPKVHSGADRQKLEQPEDWWTIVMGSGFRGDVDQLTDEEHSIVREQVLARIWSENITEIDTGALHAVARKPD